MADRTHSHDTPTPAMSDETVPSEEFVLVPREPTHKMKEAGARENQGMYPIAIYRAMIAAAPASNPSPALAKGGDAVREIAADLERSAGKPLVGGSWGGLALEPVARAIAQDRGALSTPTEGPVSAAPANAATYEVLDEAKINALRLPLIARFAGDKDWLPIHDIGVDAPLCRIDVSGKLEPRRFSEIMELKDGDGVIHNPDDFYLDADTPTEGPASQTEGMGGDEGGAARLQLLLNMRDKFIVDAGLWEVFVASDASKGVGAWDQAPALTPPETAEAVPVGDAAQEAEAYIQAAVDRAPEPLRRLGEWLANKLDEDDWKTAERMLLGAAAASDPASASLEERDCPTCAGNGEVVKDWEKYLHGEGGPEQEDHGVEDCTDCGGSGRIASDPAPVTDDRERLVEAEAVFRKIREYAENIAFSAGVGESEIAGQIVSFLVDRPELLRDFMAGTLSAIDTGMLDHHNGVLSYWGMDGEVHRPDPRQARFPALRAALATEASR